MCQEGVGERAEFPRFAANPRREQSGLAVCGTGSSVSALMVLKKSCGARGWRCGGARVQYEGAGVRASCHPMLGRSDVRVSLHVRPDRRANYDTVAKVLALAQRNGMQRIGFVGNEQFME